jgi:tetratricopeptide (TPR) repeat protein
MLLAARELRATVPAQPLSPQAIERTITRAFAQADVTEVVTLESRRPWALGASLGLVCAAALALLVISKTEPPVASPEVSARDAQYVAFGNVASAGKLLAKDEAVPADEPLSADQPARLALGRASVAMDAGTTVVWERARRTVRVERGRVDVEVERNPNETFSVKTDRFTVVVIGTRFTVDDRRVTVRRGIVRVLSPTGEILANELRAGGSFELAEPEPAPILTDDDEDTITFEKPLDLSGRKKDELLKRARRALSIGDVKKARAASREVLASSPNNHQEAEARMLLAECAQAAGKPRDAIRLYLGVFDRYPELAAGETALFAAARLEATVGRTEVARTLLERYLERYPRGRLQTEAARRLRALSAEFDEAP